MSFLAIDIGNTRLKWALFAQPVLGQPPVRHGAVFLETIDELAETDWAALPAPDQMLGCVVAGEAAMRHHLNELLRALPEIEQLNPDLFE